MFQAFAAVWLRSLFFLDNMASHTRRRLHMLYIYKPSTYFSDYNGILLLLNSVFLHTAILAKNCIYLNVLHLHSTVSIK